MRSNQALSSNRQDDLLLRLKNCVGDIHNKSKQGSYSTKKYSQKESSRLINNENFIESFQLSTKRNNMNLLDYTTTNNKKQDSIHLQNKKSNIIQDQQNILFRTKRYLQGQQNHNKSYWTDRKRQSLPLNQSTNLLNIRKNIFGNQNFQQKLSSVQKNVTQSTKKKILQRASLIDEEKKMTPTKSFQNYEKTNFSQQNFLDRLKQKKAQYGYQRKQYLVEKLKSYRQSPTVDDYRQSSQGQSFIKNQINVSNQAENKIKYEPLQKNNSQKYENYSKFSMQTLVKENDLRKTQKMQKLKKITEINQGINNRIRKLVDNFQNYLTHRVIS